MPWPVNAAAAAACAEPLTSEAQGRRALTCGRSRSVRGHLRRPPRSLWLCHLKSRSLEVGAQAIVDQSSEGEYLALGNTQSKPQESRVFCVTSARATMQPTQEADGESERVNQWRQPQRVCLDPAAAATPRGCAKQQEEASGTRSGTPAAAIGPATIEPEVNNTRNNERDLSTGGPIARQHSKASQQQQRQQHTKQPANDPVLPHETTGHNGNNEGGDAREFERAERRREPPSNAANNGTGRKEGAGRRASWRPHRAPATARQQRHKQQQQQFARDEKHPLDAASLISKLFFGWMFPFIYRGWRFGLERADLPRQASSDEGCSKIGDKLVANWNKELASCNRRHLRPAGSTSAGGLYEKGQLETTTAAATGAPAKRPSLMRAVIRTHAKWILFNSSITLFAEVVCKSLSAYSVGQMLELMSQRELADYSRVWSLEEPLVCWTLALVASLALWVLSAHFYGFQMMRVGLHVRVGCSYLIYRKSLKLGQFESSQKTMGKMINLMTNDLDKFNFVFIVLPFIWIGPLQCAVSVYLLWPTLGFATFGGLLVICFLLSIHFYLGSRFANYRRRIAAITDERVRLLDETIGALKLIKLYAWEYPVRSAMLEVRRRETDLINRVGIIKAATTALMYVSGKLVLFVTLLLHCFVFGATLDARTLFMSMALLNNIQFGMCQLMPRAIGLLVESSVSLARIGNFLLSNEFEASPRLSVAGGGGDGEATRGLLISRQQVKNPSQKVSVEYSCVGASWPEATSQTLDSISFRCQSPSLVAVCGPMASGKSSLLLSILNELPISGGKAHLSGLSGYSSQKAWIFNGTLRENILFGAEFNEHRYRQVLDACALTRDLELLECADLTYIQANSLSGGQQARVNLARCLYRQCDIYLLDDPFSALDGRVAEHIFEEAIKRFLANKLVLLATHSVGMLKQSDKVLLLDGGKQLAYCGYNELHRKLTSAGKCFTDEQLQRLSFLVEGLGEPTAAAAAAANDNERPDNAAGSNGAGRQEPQVFGGSGDKMLVDNCCCEVAFDGIIDKASTDSSARDPASVGQQAPAEFGTSLAPAPCAVAAATSTHLAVRLDVPDGKSSLRSILASKRGAPAGDQNYQANLAAHSAAVALTASEEPKSPTPTAAREEDLRPRPRRESSCEPATVAYGQSKGGTGDGLISARGASGNAPVGATISAREVTDASALADVNESGTGGANAMETEGTKVEGHSSSGRKVDSSSATIGPIRPYRTTSADDSRRGAQSCSPPVFESDGGGGVATEQEELRQEPMLVQAPSAVTSETNLNGRIEQGSHDAEKEVGLNKAIGGAKAKNGPADEETSIGADSNKLAGLHVWYKYYTQTSLIRLMLIILTFLITQALFSTVDIYLTVWSLVEQNRALLNEITVTNQQQLALFEQHRQLDGSERPRLEKFDYGDGVVERTPRRTAINGSTISGGGGGLEYDLMANGGGIVAPSLYQWLPRGEGEEAELGAPIDDDRDTGVDAGSFDEIGKASISPLSLRSSRQTASSQVARIVVDSFVPSTSRVVDLLFYVRDDVDLASIVSRGEVATSLDATDRVPPKPKVKQSEQVLHQAADSAGNRSDAASNGTTNNYHGNLVESTSGSVDPNIREQSDEALNVKSIYRPLYLFAINLTSGHGLELVYATLLLVLFLASSIANILLFTSSTKSAIILYRKLIDNALFARLAFFDINPSGRLLNRATRDIGIVDETIPMQAQQAYELLLRTAATFIIVAATDFNLALPSVIILFIFLIYHSISVKPTKDIQRLEGILRSPILSHISTSLDGLHTIRASRAEHRFEQLFIKHQDENSSAFLLQIGCNRFTAIVLDFLNAFYTSIIALWAVVSGLSGPAAGLIVTSAMLLSGLTSHGILKLTETESLMTSVERVIEYCSLPQEENYDTAGRKRRLNRLNTRGERLATGGNYNIIAKQQQQLTTLTSGCAWPNSGSVEYRNVDFYYNKLEKPILKNISFRLRSGEKVGIVGRTGAGKSSIIATLFRLYDFNGTILIDGVNIKSIDLIQLRSAIGVIPQSPVLFSTTIRRNLDPFDEYDDSAMWSALDKAHLRNTVAALPGKLDYDIGSGGHSFSAGQKQLVCLARVLLRQSRLIVMDEATANVDPNIDSIIQATIRREFKRNTVITIAHRLETILDYDRIMVLDAGRIVDFDTPERLASKKDGFFARSLNKVATAD